MKAITVPSDSPFASTTPASSTSRHCVRMSKPGSSSGWSSSILSKSRSSLIRRANLRPGNDTRLRRERCDDVDHGQDEESRHDLDVAGTAAQVKLRAGADQPPA